MPRAKPSAGNSGGPDQWLERIVGHGYEAPGQLLANPLNFRIHPLAQQEAMTGELQSIGWVRRILVNRPTGYVVDGHMRVLLADGAGQRQVPVDYVELTLKEEQRVIAAHDSIAAMATVDTDALRTLLATMDPVEGKLREMLGKMAGVDSLKADDTADKLEAEEKFIRTFPLYLDETNYAQVTGMVNAIKGYFVSESDTAAVVSALKYVVSHAEIGLEK